MTPHAAAVIFPGLGGSRAEWRAAIDAVGLRGRVRAAVPADEAWIGLGHSMGGVQALEAAAAAPDGVRALVLTAGFFPPARAGRSLPAAAADYAAHRVAYVRWLAAQPRAPHPTGTGLRQLAGLARLGLRPNRFHHLASQVQCPVLVIHAADDHVVPIAFASATAARHPTWDMLRLPAGGHNPHRDRPLDWAALVGPWLAAHAAGVD